MSLRVRVTSTNCSTHLPKQNLCKLSSRFYTVHGGAIDGVAARHRAHVTLRRRLPLRISLATTYLAVAADERQCELFFPPSIF